MDSSEADLGRVESQRLTDVSHDPRNGTYVPMNLINKGANPLGSQGGMSQSGGDSVTPPTGDNVSVPEFRINIRLSDHFALPGEYVQMTPEIFSGISNGKKECLEKLRSHGTPMARLKSNRGDSVLHLAATWGHLELVKEIVSECPSLLMEPNLEGQTPLHVAAHAGRTTVVEALIASVTFASARLCNEDNERMNPYVLKDEDGNTALHLAIEGRHLETAECLVNADHDASFLGNNKEISSLYMAIEVGDVPLVMDILKTTRNEDLEEKKSKLDSKLQGRKNLAHAALLSKNSVMLNLILDEYPTLLNEQDSEGRTCLSFGISIGDYEGVFKLFRRSEIIYVCDADGSFPIHTAAAREHSTLVEAIVRICPDSKHLLNKLGQNALHIAAKNGRYWSTEFLMKNKDTKHLSVGQDVDGNTPLHLAVINWQYKLITCLAKSNNVLNIRNKRGLTARDIAELELKPEYIFKERWTLALLLHIIHTKRFEGFESIYSLTRQSDPPKNNKDYVNTLLLVAALVATMTFAAGFTIPGGFNSSPPNLGRATLATNPTLLIFLLLDILAMQSSLATICTLIWAQLGDPALIRSSLNVALPLLLFALLCMPLAFLFGVITAVGHVKWLLAIICIISISFFCCAIFVLGPHVMLQGSYVSPNYTGDFLVAVMQYKERFKFLGGVINMICFVMMNKKDW